jgi:hypothetical protein
MGCPICIGYAMSATELLRGNWPWTASLEEDAIESMLGRARVAPMSEVALQRRLRIVLHTIIFDLLRRVLLASEMKENAAWLLDLPNELDVKSTLALVDRLKDSAIAWEMEYALTGAELWRKYITRVQEVLAIVDSLLLQDAPDYTSAGSGLANAMLHANVPMSGWLDVFNKLVQA